MGSRNHEIVPTSLLGQIAQIKNSNLNRVISVLAKNNLLSKEQYAKCRFSVSGVLMER